MLKRSNKEITSYNDYTYLMYVRVSSDKDEQKDSVSNQIDICRYWLEQNGFEYDERSILKDEGKSGTMFLERTAMQLILNKARSRDIQMVVFKSIHRLARDLKDALEIKEVLTAHGVRVVTVEEGYDSLYEGKNDMKFEMFSMFAAQYPKTLSVSISSALAAKVRRGDHIGRVPFGYERINNKLVIKEEEAQVIRQIFRWYNHDGLGFKNIVHMLNKGVEKGELSKPKKGGFWQLTTVQSLIRNPTFCGDFILNRYTTIKIDGKKKQIQNPEEKWTIFENHHPAIVSKEEWKQANNKPVINKKRKISPWNEFRGLMKCGMCGCSMVVMQSWKKKKDGSKTRWRYLKCSAYRRAGKNGCQNHVPLTYEDFRDFLLKRLIKKGDHIDLGLENGFGKQKERRIISLEKTIVNIEEKKHGLVDLYLDKLIDKQEFQLRKQNFEERINTAKEELFLLKEEENSKVAIKDIQQAFKKVKNKDKDIHHALNILIDHIVIHQDGSTDISYNFEG